ncbi:pentapeptide repeat-containing protein [Microcoleus sp. S36a_D3]
MNANLSHANLRNAKLINTHMLHHSQKPVRAGSPNSSAKIN